MSIGRAIAEELERTHIDQQEPEQAAPAQQPDVPEGNSTEPGESTPLFKNWILMPIISDS